MHPIDPIFSKVFKDYVDEIKKTIKSKKYDTKPKYLCLQVSLNNLELKSGLTSGLDAKGTYED